MVNLYQIFYPVKHGYTARNQRAQGRSVDLPYMAVPIRLNPLPKNLVASSNGHFARPDLLAVPPSNCSHVYILGRSSIQRSWISDMGIWTSMISGFTVSELLFRSWTMLCWTYIKYACRYQVETLIGVVSYACRWMDSYNTKGWNQLVEEAIAYECNRI